MFKALIASFSRRGRNVGFDGLSDTEHINYYLPQHGGTKGCLVRARGGGGGGAVGENVERGVSSVPTMSRSFM